MTNDERWEVFCFQGKVQGRKKQGIQKETHTTPNVGMCWVEFRRRLK